jgi:hypothetical protein
MQAGGKAETAQFVPAPSIRVCVSGDGAKGERKEQIKSICRAAPRVRIYVSTMRANADRRVTHTHTHSRNALGAQPRVSQRSPT